MLYQKVSRKEGIKDGLEQTKLKAAEPEWSEQKHPGSDEKSLR